MTKHAAEPSLDLHNFEPERAEFLSEVLDGLNKRGQKLLPCKYLYDERGSQLFDAICAAPEYYPTRTELGIMREFAPDMAAAFGPKCMLIEYGSGSSVKIRLLLDHLENPAAYVPLDISRDHLMKAAGEIVEAYPGLNVVPVCADYTAEFELPQIDAEVQSRTAYYPGSTIGNFHPTAAVPFLQRIAMVVGSGGLLLLGVDLRKNAAVLEAAYNDAGGVTAAFNLNLLTHINRELDADFDLDQFEHRALFNPDESRIEMHLFSRAEQRVSIAGTTIEFRQGESIRTECSYKYTLDRFRELAGKAGFNIEQVWTDAQKQFSVQLLRVR